MRRILFMALLVAIPFVNQGQDISDLFSKSDTKISWLGIDYSHVQLIGDFSEFADAGGKSAVQVKETYFPKWNYLFINESSKFDVRGMVRKSEVENDIDMIMLKNAEASVEDMEVYTNTPMSEEDVAAAVKEYDLSGKSGLGMALIAECMNKNQPIAIYHFVVVDLSSGELLLTQKFETAPAGIGLRNFWAGSFYKVVSQIEKEWYKKWKKQYASKK